MARRIQKSLWGAAFQRTLTALTRSTMKAGTRAMVKATRAATKTVTKSVTKSVKKSVARSAASAAARIGPPPGAGDWLSGVVVGPTGARRYHLYKPPGVRASERLPLLVMLHGCGQDGKAFAVSTGMNKVAARGRFMVLYPEQDRLANPQGCWNWYDTRSGRAQGEAALVMAAVDQVGLLYRTDPKRVAVAGLSAGAGMAALLATRYPARFRAVVMHSGVAPGNAHSTATALGAMRGRRSLLPSATPTVVAAVVAAVGEPALPPLLVIHGHMDHVVALTNARAAALQWADAAGAREGTRRRVQRGKRYPMNVTDFKRGGRIAASLCEVDVLGHAWSGGAAKQAFSDARGPDASRMAWAFASRQFRAVLR